MSSINYQLEPKLEAEEFIDCLVRSTLAERRPVDDRETIDGMLKNAGVIVTARTADGLLVGVSRGDHRLSLLYVSVGFGCGQGLSGTRYWSGFDRANARCSRAQNNAFAAFSPSGRVVLSAYWDDSPSQCLVLAERIVLAIYQGERRDRKPGKAWPFRTRTQHQRYSYSYSYSKHISRVRVPFH